MIATEEKTPRRPAGPNLRHHKPTCKQLDPKHIAGLYEKGFSITELAKRFGVGRDDLKSVLTHYHVTMRSRIEQIQLSKLRRVIGSCAPDLD